jgi:hypothetical protein
VHARGALGNAGRKHRLFVVKQLVELAFRNLGAGRDIERAGAVETPLREQQECRIEDRPAARIWLPGIR